MTNTSAKQQRARRESDVHDYVLSKPEIKKKWLLQAMPVFFSFFNWDFILPLAISVFIDS